MKRDPASLAHGAVALVAFGALGWFAACSDGNGPVCCPPPEGVIVSNPVASAALTAETGGALALATGAADELAYVSLAPGTVPTGSQATVQRVGDPTSLTTAVTDGGFDPVPVLAQAADSIEVVVRDHDGAVVLQETLLVAAARRPIVIRTDPPPRKRDVPLNASVVIVFSEPMNAGSLNSSSVRLLRGTTPVAGTVRLLEGTATAAVFTPDAALDANTDYQLVVTQAVRDLGGDPLGAETTVEFTTGIALVGPVASVSVLPDSLEVLVGTRFQLTAIATDSQGIPVTGRPTTWTSDDPSVATVSPTGLVTALAEGYLFVAAEIEGQRGGVTLSVRAELIPVQSVTVTPESARVAVGYTLQLVAEIWDTTGANIWPPRPIAWSSTDPTVATVTPYHSRTAIVTGVRAGSARVSATVEGKSDTAIVTISKVGSVVVTPESATVAVHGTIQLSVTLLDLQGRILHGGPIAWRSTEPTVATVDSTGMVRGVGTGATSVIAASERVSDTSAIAAWLVPGGRIAFRSERNGNSEVHAMNADGSGVERLTSDGASDGGPAWSPDGLKVAFDRVIDRNANPPRHQIYVMNADGSQVTALAGGTDPAWSRDGARIAGAREITTCGPRFCNGTSYRIFVMHPDGSGLVELTSSGFDREPAWSPDGKIAFTNTRTNGADIFLMNADGTGLTNLTNNPASDDSPAWSPDGTKIAFRSNRTGLYDLYVMNADGSGVTALTADSSAEGRPAWSPDGTKIAFASNRDGDYEIYVMNVNGSGVVRLTDNPAVDTRPAWTR